jgi:hypothetical protein
LFAGSCFDRYAYNNNQQQQLDKYNLNQKFSAASAAASTTATVVAESSASTASTAASIAYSAVITEINSNLIDYLSWLKV